MKVSTRSKGTAQAGVTLVETMVALALLLIIVAGVMVMTMTAIATTENQGHLAARTAEYAQDKMEQLLALSYSDSISDTTVFPSATTGGTGLAAGGGLNAGSPVSGYVDYLDASGNLLISVGGAAPAGWFYIRVWSVSVPSTNLKQISVLAQTKSDVGLQGALPRSTVVALKTSPF
jgi:Prokaryotic N-terminal methylation motif